MRIIINALTLSFVLCSAVSTRLFAQTSPKPTMCRVEGRVLDSKGLSLTGVLVQLLRASDSTVLASMPTDEKGHYQQSSISPGRYFVRASLIGYNTGKTKVFTLNGGQKLNQALMLPDLALSEHATQLKGVGVTAKKALIERQLDKTVLNIENDIIASGGTALDALKRAPGITVDKDENIQLRGKDGVSVMIDGKLTYMSTSQITTLLSNMPASSISQIEVITQPSSKYDAAGNVGIINIRTKKLKKSGLNGLASIGYGYGNGSKYNGSLNINYQRGPINFFGNYDYSNHENTRKLYLTREITNDKGSTVFDQYSRALNHYTNNNYKAGIDYSISKNHTVGIAINGYSGQGETNSASQTSIANIAAPRKTDSTLHSTAHNPASYSSIDYTLNYRGNLDTLGTTLGVDLDYSKFNNQYRALYSNAFFLPQQTIPFKGPYLTTNSSPSLISIRVVRLDFSHPLSKTLKIEAGFKYSRVSTDNSVNNDSIINGITIPSLSLNDHFVYLEKIAAAYASLNKKIKGTTIQVGLRIEHTASEGTSFQTGQDTKRSYTDFFPNVAISQKIGTNHQLSLSYSRRIDRPSYGDLNPFRFRIDQYTSQVGNPFLKPQYTNSFELAHTYKQGTIFTLNYSHTKDVSTEFIRKADNLGSIEQTNLNLANMYSLGLSFSTTFVFASWWTFSPNAALNYNLYTAPANSAGGKLRSGKPAPNIQVTSSFRLPEAWTAELQGYYNAPTVSAYFHSKAQYALSAGVQKDFLKKKATLKLNVNDIFNTAYFGGKQQNQGLTFSLKNRYESRKASVTFSYRFGRTIVGERKHQESHIDDSEKRRVKSSN